MYKNNKAILSFKHYIKSMPLILGTAVWNLLDYWTDLSNEHLVCALYS